MLLGSREVRNLDGFAALLKLGRWICSSVGRLALHQIQNKIVLF